MAYGAIYDNNGSIVDYPEPPREGPAGHTWDPINGTWVPEPEYPPAPANIGNPPTPGPGPGPGPNINPTPSPNTTMGSLAYDPSGFMWPQANFSRFQAPPPFAYDAFKAPTLEDAYAEPGYDFARKEGMRALENSAAGKGVLRTGGTLKDLVSWGNRFAEQNYGNVFNRGLTTYQTNRNNAAENYMTNYGVSRDVFDRNYRAEYDEFQPKQRQAELTFDDLYRRWKAELDATTSIATAGAGI